MTPINSLILVLSCSIFYFALARNEFVHKPNEKALHYHTLQPSSLLPSSTCIPSVKGDKKKGLLEVVHKHGPCSTFSEDMVNPLTVDEILTHDQSRVDSIRARLTIKKGETETLGSKATLPAESGRTIGSGNYIVTVGLGTPKKDLSLEFDTGSDLTWTQCEPCVVSCYMQKEPIFAPSASSTYSNISCTSPECAELVSATGFTPGCTSGTCVYGIQYGDKSFTVGFFGKEKLTITPNDIVNDFYFGCGQDNEGLFNGSAGILGLGRDKLSIVSQAATQYGKVFSYCLPSTSSDTGYLTFGSSEVSSNVTYTPFSKDNFFYGLDLQAIYVGGTKLEISPTVFQTSGMIIDSGTVITRLPPTAYTALREAFRAQMTQYKLTEGIPKAFDTCYDFTNTPTVTIPIISMLWAGNVLVDTAPSGILYFNRISQVCLAYFANSDDSQLGIYGNTQQKTLQVVYDVNAGKLGFAQGGCA
uniref:aspartyl protease family protein At5g10770-like n=1 Tax=Erigeron canadensis TaxID=72917 RepID=UPI001CB95804|nr:aspartyl protease family protein At5g10770-like [Erigeron canadensis]